MNSYRFQETKETFLKNQESVQQLLNFDRIILDLCIRHIEDLEFKLKNNAEIQLTMVHLLPSHTIKVLKGIREHDSLRAEYEGMFNQGLVLAVSHFTSALHGLFKEGINQACCCCPDLLTATGEDIKITFDELKNFRFNLSEGLGDLVVKKKDISFQDMQSVHRAYKNFFGLELAKDNITNNIIIAQASRHAIVHALGIADEKFMKQIQDANPRDIKLGLIENESIQFSATEVEQIMENMSLYLDRLIAQLDERIEKSMDFNER